MTEPAPPPSPDHWKPWTGIAALVLALIVVFFAAAFVGAFAELGGADFDSPGANIVVLALQAGIFVSAAVFFAQLVDIPRPRDFGLRPPDKRWLAVALVPAAWLVFIGLSWIWVQAIGQSPEEDLPDELGVGSSDVAFAFLVVLVCVFAPVGEEFLFRGYIFRSLRNWKGMVPAAIISGCIFGLIHGLSADAVALVPLAILGIAMALVYHYTGSLYVAMSLHALNNAIAISDYKGWDWQIPLVIVGGIAGTLLVGYGVQRAIDAGGRRLEGQRVA